MMLFTVASFVILTTVFTILYLPVLLACGDGQQLFRRSARIGAIGAGAQVVPDLLLNLLNHAVGTGGAYLSTSVGLLVSTYVVVLYLKRSMLIRPWRGCIVVFVIALLGLLLLPMAMSLLFSLYGIFVGE